MINLKLPTLHAGQIEAFKRRRRLNALRCGRRWGKDVFMITLATDRAIKGKAVGLFAPEHKQLVEPFDAVEQILAPIKRRSNRTEGTFRTNTKGIIDFWTLNDNPLAGRGREYDLVIINEASFTKTPQMLDTWRKAIRPTLLVRRGSAWVLSTPAGIDEENFFHKVCNDTSAEFSFNEFHAPTNTNPFVPAEEFERERESSHPLVFQQEYLAEFVDWSGVAFFEGAKWLDGDGQPFPYYQHCDGVFAVLDTAVKTGKEHDATAVIYYGVDSLTGPPMMILDWDLVQIEGGLLETWLPVVYQRLDMLAQECRARKGSLGAFIEDKASGTILLQQAARRGWAASAIDGTLTAMGKDERAISVSGYHYQGKCKISRQAFDKQTTFKGTTRNHLRTQVVGFRIGDKDAAKRADDLTDCYCYGLSLAFGDSQGF